MKTVSMTIKRKWFDLILSVEKKEEYRDVTKFYTSRLVDKGITHLKLINGYGRDRPYIVIELKSIKTGLGNPYHGAPLGIWVYILELGEIIEAKNIREEICCLCERTDYGSFLMPFNGYCPVECCVDSCQKYLLKTTNSDIF